MINFFHSTLGKIAIGIPSVALTALFISVSGFQVAYAAKGFVVEKSGSDNILITDGYSEYVIEYNYDCYSSDFYEGETIYIDTSYSPSYGDKIIITGGYSKKICEVTNADDVNIRRYYVDDVFDSEDKIIVTDKNNDKFLVEYGIGCGVSMWRYEGKVIEIDIGGSFLDGIGDRMYLFDSGRDCKVWDAEELDSSGSGFYSGGSGYTAPASTPASCPSNSSNVNGTCTCGAGYVANGSVCITETQGCQNKYGSNSYGSEGYCRCSSGYQFNESQTSCVSTPQVTTQRIAPPTDPIEQCTHKLGPQGIVSGQNACGCVSGYELNEQKNYCVLKPPTTLATMVPVAAIPKEVVKDDFEVSSQDIEQLRESGTLISAAAFRKCPSTRCTVIRYYAETSDVSVIGKYKKGDWYQIGGTADANSTGARVVGWIYQSLIKIGTEKATRVKNAESIDAMTTENLEATSSSAVEDEKVSFLARIWRNLLNWFGK